MFIGHYGVGFAGKSVEPKVSLGTWILAAQFLDLLWPIFLLLGWEHVRIVPGNTRWTPLDFYDYPISHSLVGALAWSAAFALVTFALRRQLRTAILLGAGVFSHWLLDLIVHRPDLPILGTHGPRVGFGLWQSVPGTLIVEVPIFLIGVALYVRATAPRDRIGNFGLWAGLAALALFYVSDLMGPPPTEVTSLPYMGLLGWLIVVWGYWVDRHRSLRPKARETAVEQSAG